MPSTQPLIGRCWSVRRPSIYLVALGQWGIPMLSVRDQQKIETSGHAQGARARGFTLIELMVTIAVLAIVTAIAYPSFTSLMNSSRLTGAANDLVGDLQTARSEAIRRNARVTVCASADNTTCAGAAGDWQSWIVWIDNPAPTADEVLRVGHAKAPLQVLTSPAVTGNAGSIVFRADGMARAANGSLLTASIAPCMVTTSPAENMRVVRIASGSRVSTTKATGAGVCAAPAN